MSNLLNKLTFKLQGGGCGSIKTIPNTDIFLKSDIQDIENFITSHIMVYFFRGKYLQTHKEFLKGHEIIQLNYRWNLKLLKSFLIYVKTDQFKCLFILSTTASLSKVIFSFLIRKDQRFMNCGTQKQFVEICDELTQQIEIEKNDLIQLQLELYLFLTKISFQMAPNDGKDRDDILKVVQMVSLTQYFDMKPNTELFMQLYRGACLLQNKYADQKNREQYEVYFSIDFLQWEIINNLKNDSEQNLEEIIMQLDNTHQQLVKNSSNRKIIFCGSK